MPRYSSNGPGPGNGIRSNPWWFTVVAPLASLLLVFAFLLLLQHRKVERLNYISALPGWSVADAPKSREGTDFALILPGSGDFGMALMDQSRQMAKSGNPRLTHIDYENAPYGHDLNTASPFRWWLSALAWAERRSFGRTVPASLDSTAIVEGPALLFLLVASAAAFGSWRFGWLPTAIFVGYLGLSFPLSAAFLPGAPDPQQLALVWATWSVLPLLAAIGSGKHRPALYFIAGLGGGLGLWTSVADQLPVLVGIGLGGLFAAHALRGSRGTAAPSEPHLWRLWALGGAVVTLLACLADNRSNRMGLLDLTVIHPLYGIAWLGGAELLVEVSRKQLGVESESDRRRIGVVVLALVAFLALPFAIWKTQSLALLLAGNGRLSGPLGASGTAVWLAQGGLTPFGWATILPLGVVIPASWIMVRRIGASGPRTAVGLALGTALALSGMTLGGLRWWDGCDVILSLLALVTVSALVRSSWRPVAVAALCCGLVVLLVPGALRLLADSNDPPNRPLDQEEVSGWLEKDIARWLRLRETSPDAIVLAPSRTTVALHHFGGFMGLGTLERDNREGVAAAVRIVNAATFEEAQDLIQQRGITAIVIPSWDKELSFYSGASGEAPGDGFLGHILNWNLPPWLRPLAYPMPNIPGDLKRSVTILEVIDSQDTATSYGRLAEYFVETGHAANAEVVARALQRYPGNAGALAARAEVASARGDRDEFLRLVGLVAPIASSSSLRGLPWDRRISLAIVLAQGRQLEAAKRVYLGCLSEMDPAKLRSLSVGQLYHLHVLGKLLKLGIIDPGLREYSLELLPPGVRARLSE